MTYGEDFAADFFEVEDMEEYVKIKKRSREEEPSERSEELWRNMKRFKRDCTKDGIDVTPDHVELMVVRTNSLRKKLESYKPYYTGKGIETKRRDAAPYLREIIEGMCQILVGLKEVKKKLYRQLGLEKLVKHKSKIMDAVIFSQSKVIDLLEGKVPTHKLILSNSLKKPVDEYKPGKNIKNTTNWKPPAHVYLTKRIMKRAPGTEAKTGDRVQFVLVQTGLGKDEKTSDKAETPSYVLENRIPIDYEYYANRKVIPAICRVLGSLVGTYKFDHIDYVQWDKKKIEKETRKVIEKNKKQALDLFRSDGIFNVKKRVKRPYKAQGLYKYFDVRAKCVNCGVRLEKSTKRHKRSRQIGVISNSDNFAYLCRDCEKNKVSVLNKLLKKKKQAEDQNFCYQFECRCCQKEFYNVVTCANTECPIYFRKMESKNDIEDIDVNICKMFPKCNTVEDAISKIYIN